MKNCDGPLAHNSCLEFRFPKGAAAVTARQVLAQHDSDSTILTIVGNAYMIQKKLQAEREMLQVLHQPGEGR